MGVESESFPPENSDEFDLNEAMAAMGVRPLKEGGTSTARGKRNPEPKRTKRVVPVTNPTAITEDAVELERLSMRCKALQKALSDSNEKLNKAEAALSLLTEQNKALSNALVERPPLEVEEAENELSIEKLFKSRGVRGRSEISELLSTLIKSQRLFDIFPDLTTVKPRTLRHLLDSTIVLHCGSDKCTVKGPVLTVLVAADRCEMCGGSAESGSPLTQLSDELMLRGITRLAVITKNLAVAKAVKAGVHHRIDLTILPIGVGPETHSRQQLAIDWGEHAPSKSGAGEGTVILRCKGSGVAELSKRVCSYLKKLD